MLIELLLVNYLSKTVKNCKLKQLNKRVSNENLAVLTQTCEIEIYTFNFYYGTPELSWGYPPGRDILSIYVFLRQG